MLPESAQIGKDAKAAFARSAGIFILYLTACANDFYKDAKRDTISATDVMTHDGERGLHWLAAAAYLSMHTFTGFW